ncbi:MAG: major tail protein [Bacillota bacterium]
MPEKIAVGTGLKNIYYAKVLTDDSKGTTYDTPKKFAPAITMNVTPTVNSTILFAENGPHSSANALGEITAEIGVADVPFSVRADVLGSKLKENGLLVDNAEDQAPEVALGYERTMDDGSSRYIWLLKGKFKLPTEEAATQADTPAFQTPTMEATFLKRHSDGNWRFMTDSNITGSEDLIKSWFTAVPDDVPTV